MRTTLTLEPEVAARVRALARRRGASLEATINDLLRRGLGAQQKTAQSRGFTVEPHRGGFRPGVDPTRLAQIADDLENGDFVDEAASRR